MIRIRGKFGQGVREHHLVSECEAFLTGRYAPNLDAEHLPIPAWAWLNTLAHGGPEQITAQTLALDVHTWFDPRRAWEEALSYLAHEVLSLVEQGSCTLEEIQRSSLVPVELELAAVHPWDWEPSEVVHMVLDALDESQARHRRGMW